MGALHAGHASLIELAQTKNLPVILSIFVNPSQFNDPKDLEKYPRTLEADLELAESLGVDLVFFPDSKEIYPASYRPSHKPNRELIDRLCGKDRPGHFEGVLSVVERLFQLIEPAYAAFGEKDFQQLRLIENMVSQLNLPVEILRGPTVREESGLALSSRNKLLSAKARNRAESIIRSLRLVAKLVSKESMKPSEAITKASSLLEVDELIYFEVLEEKTLSKPNSNTQVSGLRALIAAEVAGVRLIDNLAITQ